MLPCSVSVVNKVYWSCSHAFWLPPVTAHQAECWLCKTLLLWLTGAPHPHRRCPGEACGHCHAHRHLHGFGPGGQPRCQERTEVKSWTEFSMETKCHSWANVSVASWTMRTS